MGLENEENLLPIEKPTSLGEATYNRIKELILDASFSPGQLIYELQLASTFKVSRTPVHWALIRLEQEGWIEQTDGHGYVISHLKPSDVHDIYEMRLLLEPRLASYFAQLAPDDKIDRYIKLLPEIEVEIEAGNYALFFSTHRLLHQDMIDHCPNPLLKKMVVRLNESMRWIRNFTGIDPNRHVQASFDEQRKIILAIRQRAANEAERSLAAHLFAAEARVIKQLEEVAGKSHLGEDKV